MKLVGIMPRECEVFLIESGFIYGSVLQTKEGVSVREYFLVDTNKFLDHILICWETDRHPFGWLPMEDFPTIIEQRLSWMKQKHIQGIYSVHYGKVLTVFDITRMNKPMYTTIVNVANILMAYSVPKDNAFRISISEDSEDPWKVDRLMQSIISQELSI